MLQILFAFLIVPILTDCAMSNTLPPGPPLAIPVAGGPDEYVVFLPIWKPGATTIKKTQVWAQVRAGEQVVLNHVEQSVFTAKGIDRSARGLTRVEFSIDGQDLGFALLGEDGKAQDIAVTNPRFLKIPRRPLSPW